MENREQTWRTKSLSEKGKLGFQKVKKSDQRTEILNVKVTKTEKRKIVSYFKKKGLNQSEFLRLAVETYLETIND